MSSHPLPLTKNEALRVQNILTGLAALFTLIPLSYCAASFAIFVIQERVVKAKLLQMVSGASSFSYWAAAYAWDMLSYLAIVSTTMLVLVLYQDQSFTGSWAKASAAVALLIAFGLAVVPLTYCYSFAFSNHANAQVAIAGLHFITGFGMLGSSILMSSLENTKVLNEHLILVYQLFPPYNLGRGLANLASLDLESTLRGRASNPYLWDVTGRALALMLLEAAESQERGSDIASRRGEKQREKQAIPKYKGASSSTPTDDRLSSLEQRTSQGGPSRNDADEPFSDDDSRENSTAAAKRKAPAKRAAPKDTESPRGGGGGRGRGRGGLTQTTLNVVVAPRPPKRAAAASRPKSVSDDEASDSDKDIEDEVEEPAHKIKRTSATTSQRGRKTATATKRGAASSARGTRSSYIDDDVEDDDGDAGPKKATPKPSSQKRSSWGFFTKLI